MRTLVTGVGGFLGRAVIAALQGRGHDILAMIRPASSSSASFPPGVTPLPGDLRQRADWTAHLGDVEAVIHCAASGTGDLPTQLAGTILATENLLASLPATLKHFVHVSSFSVYDYSAPGWQGKLDEETPIEGRPLRRDAYTQTKLQQEAMVREHCRAKGIALTVVRPGAIYGPGRDWDHGSALRFGGLDLVFAPLSRMRLVHVDDCAQAIAAAIDREAHGETIVNVVGDNQPTHWGFHRRSRRAGADTAMPVPIPYFVVRLLGAVAWLASRLFFAGRARLPEWLDLPRQEARWRPLRYGNARVKDILGWQERVPLDSGIASAIADQTTARLEEPVSREAAQGAPASNS